MADRVLSLAIVVAGAVAAPAALTSLSGLSASISVTCSMGARLIQSPRIQLSLTIEPAFSMAAGLRHGRLHRAKAHIRVIGALQAEDCGAGNGATVLDGVNAIVAMWGQRAGNGDTPEKGEAVGFLNAAMQRLHESGKDYGFVGRLRRTYTGTLPVSAVELERDVQHIDGAVTLRYPQSSWLITFPSTGAINTATGLAISECLLWSVSDSVLTISIGENVADKLAIATGYDCTFIPDATAPAIRVDMSPGSNALWEPLMATAAYGGEVLASLDFALAASISLLSGGSAITFTPGTLTPLRALDESASLHAARGRMASSVYAGSTLRRPLVYHASAQKSGVSPPLVNIELAPAAEYTTGSGTADAWELQADVFLEPPRFSCCDVDAGTRIPVPHRYAESLVIPLARYFALSARYRVQDSTIAMVKEQAAQALALIGEADPRVKEVQENRKGTAIK